MNDRSRAHYFMAVRTILTLTVVIYTALSCSLLTGASVRVLLLLALFTGTMSFKEIAGRRSKTGFLIAAAVLFFVIFHICGKGTVLLGILTGYEIISHIRPVMTWYFLPPALSFINSEGDIPCCLVISVLLCLIYIQHDFVVESYRHQTKEDTINEQLLKHNIDRKEREMKNELKKSLLLA